MSDDHNHIARALRTRRLELGLSHREVANLAGLTRTAIDQVERGAALDAWPLASVRSLLGVLQLEWSDLEAPAAPTRSSLVAEVGAELARSGQVPRSQLMSCDQAVLAELRTVLSKAGMTVVETPDGLRLAPDGAMAPLPRTVRQEDERIVVDGPNAVESEVLHAAISGQLDVQRLDRSKRRALGTLLRAGLVEEREGGIMPSATTCRTLMLD